MASNMYANIVNSYGLKSNGAQAIDVINGIPVRIANTNGTATVYVYIDKDRAAAVLQPIAQAAANMGLVKPRISGDAIIFGFKKLTTAVDDYSKIRQIISDNAGSFNIDQCPYCMVGSCDVAGMFRGNQARKMHRQCFLNNRNAEMNKVENAEGNYFTGILVALLAAVIIVAFSDLLVLGAQRIYYILYIVFPFFIAGGFRLGKGPYGALGTLCHVTISVLAIFAYFYIQGCYYIGDAYGMSMLEVAPYFTDVLSVITDSEFVRESALEIVLFVVGIIIAAVANPNSKKAGRQSVQQNDVFITPLSVVDTGFSGYDTYNPFGNNDTQNATSAYDAFANQNASAGQDSANTNNDWRDVYAQNSDNNNNNGF